MNKNVNVMSNPSTVATLGAIIDRATQLGGIKGQTLAAMARSAVRATSEGEKIAYQEGMLRNVHATDCPELIGYVRSIQDEIIGAGYYLTEAVRVDF